MCARWAVALLIPTALLLAGCDWLPAPGDPGPATAASAGASPTTSAAGPSRGPAGAKDPPILDGVETGPAVPAGSAVDVRIQVIRGTVPGDISCVASTAADPGWRESWVQAASDLAPNSWTEVHADYRHALILPIAATYTVTCVDPGGKAVSAVATANDGPGVAGQSAASSPTRTYPLVYTSTGTYVTYDAHGNSCSEPALAVKATVAADGKAEVYVAGPYYDDVATCTHAAANSADTLTGTFADGRISLAACDTMAAKGDVTIGDDGSLTGWFECWGLHMPDGSVLRSLRVTLP